MDNQFPVTVIGGTVGAVIVVIVIIIVVVIIFIVVKRKSRHPNKVYRNSHEMTTGHPSTAKDYNSRKHDGLYQDVSDETAAATGVQQPHNPAENGRKSQKYEDRIYYTPTKGDGKKVDGETEVDFGALYAKVEKDGRGNENKPADFGAMYAVPDKSRKEPDGQEDTQGDDLYATPDKSLKERQEADGFRHGSKEHNEKNEGLYAMSANGSESHDVNPNGHFGTDMVENELYTMETF